MKHEPTDFDVQMMHRAIRLARRGEGYVEPNPMVGCVVTRGNRIIGEGYHRRFGGPHAEIEAIQKCPRAPRGATFYVTLEPCCIRGKTPPCTEALIRIRPARVVISALDPNPKVNGRGVRQLRRAGIRVETGICKADGLELIAPFRTLMESGRPYVIAKWAQSLDGKLATRTGDSQWISGEKSRGLVHRLRARVDAILVGVQTVLCDNPRLTARGVRIRRTARRVILDAGLRTPLNAEVVSDDHVGQTIVFTAAACLKSPRARKLRDRGVELAAVPSRRGRLDIGHVLEFLAQRGATNVLVEGGPQVLAGFFAGGCVDEAWVFTAPILFGDAKAPGVNFSTDLRRVNQATRPRLVQSRAVEADVLWRLRF